MPTVYDIVWRTLVAAAAPAWLLVPKARRKVFKAFRERTAADVPAAPPDAGPCVLIHAVSLGEINATRALVDQLAARRPALRFCVTVTTDTGFARGRELYGGNPAVVLVRFPLDLSGPIARLFDRQRPAVAVLMELEVWPNFVLHCRRRGVPVVLVNGRLTESSFRQYRLGGPLVRRMFGRLSDVCAQDAAYAERFRALGARPDGVAVTGTMKFDTAAVADRIDGDADLARDVGLRPGAEPVWVCGSTGPAEEQIVLDAYRALLATHPTLRLAIVPRHPERFDEVAALIERLGFPLVRRSRSRSRGQPLAASQANAALTSPPPPSTQSSPPPPSQAQPAHPPVVLGDTMGELRKFYAVADVVLVGRTLLDLGQRQRGSDMIEPAALGNPVIVGPWTHNFADAVRQLRQADAIVVLGSDSGDPTELAAAVAQVLSDPAAARATGDRAREVVRAQQGATARHVDVILKRLDG